MQVELNYPNPVAVSLDVEKTLLVIVDMEKDSCDPAGSSYIGEPVQRIIPRIAELRRRVREAGGLVIHSQSVRAPDALEFTVFGHKVRKIEGTWGVEFVDALRPEPGEPVVVKRTHDCFYQTEMESLLKKSGMRPGEGRIIVTGIATRGCVQCAVQGFSIRDYYVYVPLDCTTQKNEQGVLEAFSLFTGYGYQHNVTITRSDLISLNRRS